MKVCILFLTISSLFFSKTFAQFEKLASNSTAASIGQIIPFGNAVIVNGYWHYTYITYDEGKTFTQLPLPIYTWHSKILLKKDSLLFMASYSMQGEHRLLFYCSKDTGQTWELRFDTLFFYTQLYTMFNQNDGLLIGKLNEILLTHDGGYTWQPEYFGIGFPDLIESFDDSISLIGGIGYLRYSDDQWQTSTGVGFSNIDMSGLQFMSKDTFLAYGNDHINGRNLLAYTFHGFDSIKERYSPPSGFVSSNVIAKNMNEIFVIGRNLISGTGIIKETNDLGITYKNYDTGIDFYLGDMYFFNDSIALLSGSDGILLKWNKNSNATEVIDFQPNNIRTQVYPNPCNTTQQLFVQATKKEFLQIHLIDMLGRRIKQVYIGDAFIGENRFSIDTGDLPNGIYVYQIELGTKRAFIKIDKI